ncbi:phosducin isoform X1 [Crotalus tigris]|uniref:phosducin isoform X1 n=2 Tax=Crotalus tigris TaxID=88082 RepID=UPI00192F25B7|nr:phosducin isoform X1 [Crotalus tigris]
MPGKLELTNNLFQPVTVMEHQQSINLEEEFEAPEAIHTGPKGVINDWRKFKLESQDEDHLPPSKRELLIRQISSPYKCQSRDHRDTREKVSRKMSVQEYELLNVEEDEDCLQQYRKSCMKNMHERLSFAPRHGYLSDLQDGKEFLEAVEKEHKATTVIVHIYEDDIKECEALNSSLTSLAVEYSTVKFCKLKAANTGAGDRFSSDVLPTILVYKGGELVSNFISVTDQLNGEFSAKDVETFLNEYGLLPQKGIPEPDNGDMNDQEIEQ